jgi:rod shape-determining protein MreC
MPGRPRRRLLGVLVALTLALTLLDVAGSAVPETIRALSASAVGPAERFLASAHADDVAALRAENTRLRAALWQRQHELDEVADLRRLLTSEAVGGREVVAARVVATEVSLTGGRAVTLDVGSRDGVVVDSTVVAEEGLAGRVVAVGPWTSEVQLLGAPGSTVGVRVGPASILGAVGPRSAAADVARPPGTLSLDLVQPGSPVVGDDVTTLGSVGDRPYVAGVPVGRVVAVDPERGLLTRSATVQPTVDLDALDVVGVVVNVPRTAAREASR